MCINLDIWSINSFKVVSLKKKKNLNQYLTGCRIHFKNKYQIKYIIYLKYASIMYLKASMR